MSIRIWILAAVVSGVVACGGTDPCGASTCMNDPMPTPSDISTCRATLDANKNASCYKLVIDYTSCALSSRVCTSGGTTDLALTETKVTNNCKSQFDAATACCTSNQTSTACQ
jgi:hypothetical protein